MANSQIVTVIIKKYQTLTQKDNKIRLDFLIIQLARKISLVKNIYNETSTKHVQQIFFTMSSQNENIFFVMQRGFFCRPGSIKTKKLMKLIGKALFQIYQSYKPRVKDFFFDGITVYEIIRPFLNPISRAFYVAKGIENSFTT